MTDSQKVFRKEIRHTDGTVDVYEAASLAELVDKIGEGLRAAQAQTRKLKAEQCELAAKVEELPDAGWCAFGPTSGPRADVDMPLFVGVRQ